MPSWAWIGVLLLAACAKTTPQFGGETNWLVTCTQDSACSMGSCGCGVCSIACGSDRDCDGAFSGACVSADSEVGAELCSALSEPAPDALCLPRCAGDTDCGPGYACDRATCVPRTTGGRNDGGAIDAGRDGGGAIVRSDAGGVDAGSMDAGGTVIADAGHTPGPTFSARLEGVQVYLDTVSAQQLYVTSCTDDVVLQKRVGSDWLAARYDIPPSTDTLGYYLNGVFRPANPNEGCDILGCFELGPESWVAEAVEYEQIGTMPSPAPSGEQVPVILSHPLEGELRVRVQYSTDDRCSAPTETSAEFNLPPGSVCCCGCEETADAGQ